MAMIQRNPNAITEAKKKKHFWILILILFQNCKNDNTPDIFALTYYLRHFKWSLHLNTYGF